MLKIALGDQIDKSKATNYTGTACFIKSFFLLSLTPIITLATFISLKVPAKKMIKALKYVLIFIQTGAMIYIVRVSIFKNYIQLVLLVQSLELICFQLSIKYVVNIVRSSRPKLEKCVNLMFLVPILSLII